MKRTVLFAAIVAAMSVAACQSAEDRTPFTSVTLGIEQWDSATKTDIHGCRDIFWTSGDQISLKCGSEWEAFTLSSGEGTAVGTFSINKDVTINNNSLAVYPATLSPEWTTSDAPGWHITLPDTYAWSARGLKAPMMTYISEENPSWQSFVMATGAIKVDIYDIPANANKLVFTAPGNRVSGQFRLHETEGTNDVHAEDAAVNNTVTITFEAGSATSRTFLIPLPAGTYNNFTLQMYEDATPIAGTGRKSSVTVDSKKIHYLKPFALGATSPELVIWEGEKFLGDNWEYNISDMVAGMWANAVSGQTVTIYGRGSSYTEGAWTYRALIVCKLSPWGALTDGNKNLAWGSEAGEPFQQSFVLSDNDVTDIKAGGIAITGTRAIVTKVTLQ